MGLLLSAYQRAIGKSGREHGQRGVGARLSARGPGPDRVDPEEILSLSLPSPPLPFYRYLSRDVQNTYVRFDLSSLGERRRRICGCRGALNNRTLD